MTALAGEERFYEVPFSFRMPSEGRPTLVRGTIDCLVRHGADRIRVVEFKTGRPRDAHQRQLEFYVEAVRAMELPRPADDSAPSADSEVTGVLIYL